MCVTPESGVLGVQPTATSPFRVVAEGLGPDINVSSVMSKNVLTGHPDDTVDRLMRTMGTDDRKDLEAVE